VEVPKKSDGPILGLSAYDFRFPSLLFRLFPVAQFQSIFDSGSK